MAPISSRRSGHSRRAQFSVFTGYVVAAIGAVIGAILLAVSLWNPGAFSGLRGTASDVVEPAGQATATARSGTSNVFDTIAAYWRAGSKNAALRDELELARIKLAEAAATEQENVRLKGLLGLKDKEVEPVVVARLVGSTSSSPRRFAYLGAGRSDGVAVGMPVRSARGVVGRILEVGSSSSRVLLLTDSESVLPVRRAKDDTVAFAEGRGDGKLRIRLINLGINPIEKGDLFVTSGAGGFYRPGVAVAIVDEVTNDGGVAHLVSDPASADFVSVEPIWQPEAVSGASTPQEEVLGEGDAQE
ncbi:Rod shape-determining protein MreC [Altererythrobacter epoxidivorans]|uniref:Cell shape-determining protein MreC n=1 Tax=Altererythrobacter epoxidivorans TaxID=361183 RepID=A0A0M5L2J7_9SPHN|nr:rod shape-determining protein MreC [Altererythrobacter epoxidivorans]ALE16394.1 Rod shape-determining protein MreC [Altererythrobacter epoxidivorans]